MSLLFDLQVLQGTWTLSFSLVENDKMELAASLLAASLLAKDISIMLPTDVVIVDKFDADVSAHVSYILKKS
jgi:3-phosphoglycerate kinase